MFTYYISYTTNVMVYSRKSFLRVYTKNTKRLESALRKARRQETLSEKYRKQETLSVKYKPLSTRLRVVYTLSRTIKH